MIPDAPSFNAMEDSVAFMPAVTMSILPAYPDWRADEMNWFPCSTPKVKIEKHHVDIGTAEYLEALGCSAALGDHIEVRLGGQKAAQAFPEERVIVHQ